MNLLDRRFLNISLAVRAIANSPEASPIAGTQYIVGPSGTGAFSGVQANCIARYNGSDWDFTAPKAGELEVLNVSNGEILSFNGSAWTAIFALSSDFAGSVAAIVPSGDELPDSAAAGSLFINTEDGKLYTAIAADTWNSGENPANGVCYASSSDHKIYTSVNGSLNGADIADGTMFFSKADNSIYIYDAANSTFVLAGGASSESITVTHFLTASEASAKSFTLSHAIAAGKESNILCFVCGIAQAAGVDFTASGSSISWNGKGLDDIGLVEGDMFILHYVGA